MATTKEQLLEKIDNLLIDINAKYIACKSSDEAVPSEIALLAAEIDYLSAQVKALQFFVEQPVAIQQEAPSQVVAVDDEVSFAPAPEETAIDTVQQVAEETEEISEEPEPVVTQSNVHFASTHFNTQPLANPSVVEEPKVEAAYGQAVVTQVVEEPKEIVIEEKIEAVKPGRPLTLNELIQQQRMAGANLTQQFNTSSAQERIVDLKTAVSLNDKLLFIKDLFNGYSLAYNEAVELLNKYDNLAEADAFLQTSYALKNGWAQKPQTVDKFYAILQKKFIQ